MTDAPARWSPRFRLRCSGTNSSCMGGHLGGVGVHASEPSPRFRRAHPTTPVPPSPCSRRGRGCPRVGRATCSRPHAPPDPVGHTPLSHTRRLGGTPVQHRRQPRPGSYPHYRHLACSPVYFCESTGLGDDALLLGEGGNGSGSRRCAHEVWWAPACVGRS